MSELISKVGTRKIFTLSNLGHDDDVFLTKDDMSNSHWELLMGCYHQGSCDDDASEASKYFMFPSDEALIQACNYLIDCGIDRDRFCDGLEYPDRVTNIAQIIDENSVLEYYLWMLSGDIQDV